MRNKEKRKGTNVILRTSKEEKELFERYAQEKGVTVTAYVKEQCLGEHRGGIYNKEVQDVLDMIGNILYYKIKDYCNDEVFIKECKEGVERIWHCLK